MTEEQEIDCTWLGIGDEGKRFINNLISQAKEEATMEVIGEIEKEIVDKKNHTKIKFLKIAYKLEELKTNK